MKKAFSIVLSLILLTSQVHVTLGAHYCAGLKVEESISIGHTDMSCGMMVEDMQEKEVCEFSFEGEAVPCCHDTHFTISVDLEGQQIQAQIETPVSHAMVHHLAEKDQVISFDSYLTPKPIPPPLLQEIDLSILYQVFLI